MRKIIFSVFLLIFFQGFFLKNVYAATPTPTPSGSTGTCAGITGNELTKCKQCTDLTFSPRPNPDPMGGKAGVWTALGCVHTDPTEFVGQLLGWVMGIGGGIAFLLIVWGGFQILTSSGNPEKLNDGKEIIVSALTGLLMIVFSVILLRIIGVDILHIPGFGKP